MGGRSRQGIVKNCGFPVRDSSLSDRGPLRAAVMDFVNMKTIVTCIGAAMIALAAPAHADDGKTVCTLGGTGLTHAHGPCPQAPGTHPQAPRSYHSYVLPRGYGR
jgi:hypothetical protein